MKVKKRVNFKLWCSVSVKVRELMPRDSIWLSCEFSLFADAVIIDNGLGCGTVPPAIFRAILGVGVSGFSLFRRFGFENLVAEQNYIEKLQKSMNCQ